MTIQTVIAALVTLINGWKAPTNIENDIADATLALATVDHVAPGTPFVTAALKFVDQSAAGLHNVESGQAANVATKDGYSLVLVKNGGTAATTLGL